MERDTPLPSPESDKTDDKSSRKKRVYLPRFAIDEQDVQRRANDQMEAIRNAESDSDTTTEKKKSKRKNKKKPTTTTPAVGTAPEIEQPTIGDTDSSQTLEHEDVESAESNEAEQELTTVYRKNSKKRRSRKSQTAPLPEPTNEEFTGDLPAPIVVPETPTTAAEASEQSIEAEQSANTFYAESTNDSEAEDEPETAPKVVAESSEDKDASGETETEDADPENTKKPEPTPVVAAGNSNPSKGPNSATANPNTASGLPPAPPVPPPVTGFPFGPGSPMNPNVMPSATQHGTLPTPVVAAPLPKRSAETSGEPRGSLLTGLIVGAVVEHIRHKSKEKRQEKAHQKVLAEYRKERDLQQANQLRTENQTKREAVEAAHKITQLESVKTTTMPEAVPYPATPDILPAPVAVPKAVENRSPFQELPVAQAKSVESKTSIQELQIPQAKTAESLEAEQARAKIEQAIRDANTVSVPEEQPEIPKDRRVEQSAWHRIEIDKNTGKAVENPTVAYGEEFQKETHQEQLRRQIEEASMNSDLIRESYIVPKLGQSPLTPTATQPTSKKPAEAKTTPSSNTSSAPFVDSKAIDVVLWIMLAVIIFAIVSLI